MQYKEQTTFPPDVLAGFERISAKLAEVPPERISQVDEKGAIFIAGMEAMASAISAKASA